MSVPGERDEQEADSVADKVMRLPESQLPCQREPVASPENHRGVHSLHGQPLDPDTRDFMESRLGRDLSDVRIHTHRQAAASTQAIGARAYTMGRNVMFGPGETRRIRRLEDGC